MMSEEVARDTLAQDGEEPLGEDEGLLSVIDAEVGDRKIKWKRSDPASVKKAEAKFAELKGKGYRFFRIARVKVTEFPAKNGGELVATKSTQKELALTPEGPVTEFEADTKEYVAVGQPRGG